MYMLLHATIRQFNMSQFKIAFIHKIKFINVMYYTILSPYNYIIIRINPLCNKKLRL